MPSIGTVFFEAARPDRSDGYHFERPICVLEAHRPEDVPEVLESVERESDSGYYAAGYVAYEAASAFEPAAPRRAIHIPYAWFGIYEQAAHVARAEFTEPLPDGAPTVSHLRFSIPKSRYGKQVEVIRDRIREGDVYQINYTGQLRFDVDGPAEALFARLAARQPVPYAAYLDIGDAQILSCSPELFFRREGGRIATRPMKGTAIRGASKQEDERLERELAEDAKNRAENLMIVDLLRNDLSRCCIPGSVRVPKLFETERFETLIQMSSEIEGDLRPGTRLTDIFRALFPCGSVTGAPKIRAMQLIDELEDEPRGVYCGAIGFVEPGGRTVFNVAIRTVLMQKGVARLGIGSGVVWDSSAASEYDECLLKAHFLTGDESPVQESLYLIETMLADGGTIPLLELHLDRLVASAENFGIPLHRTRASERIADALDGERRQKVRLTLQTDGSIDVASSDLERLYGAEQTYDTAAHRKSGAPSDASVPDVQEGAKWRGVISRKRTDSQDPLRGHKTSSRDLYADEFDAAHERGFDEVVFLNERDELCEGSRSNIFVRSGESWRTPPLESGALPGVYRRHLLETVPNAAEATLYIADLENADAVYFSNAVRGLVEAEIVFGRAKPGDENSSADPTIYPFLAPAG